jgi:hypothetical protein
MTGAARREERIVASQFADLAWTRRATSAGVPRDAAGLFNRFGKRTIPAAPAIVRTTPAVSADLGYALDLLSRR